MTNHQLTYLNSQCNLRNSRFYRRGQPQFSSFGRSRRIFQTKRISPSKKNKSKRILLLVPAIKQLIPTSCSLPRRLFRLHAKERNQFPKFPNDYPPINRKHRIDTNFSSFQSLSKLGSLALCVLKKPLYCYRNNSPSQWNFPT